jgi:hypothetical protein
MTVAPLPNHFMSKTPKKRVRDSVRLSEKERPLLLELLRQKKLSQAAWSRQTELNNIYVSVSTIQRLVKGIKVDRGSFNNAFKCLGRNPDDFMAPRDDQQDSTTPPSPSLLQLPDKSHTEYSGTLQSFMITGTFTPNNLAEIEVSLVHLEKLLQANATFTLVADQNYLAVSGTFSENKKPEIQVALMHLEKLLLEHTTTFN